MTPFDARVNAELTVVTGAAGWLGRALVSRLVADGASVRVLVRDSGERVLVPDGVEVVEGDVSHPATADRLLGGVPARTVVVHTAGVIHPARVADFYRVNTQGTENVAVAAHRAGVARLVHVSSNSPFGTNPHPQDRFRADEPYHPYLGYGHSKMQAELAVLRAVDDGLDAVMVRPPWFYGPFQPPRQTTFFKMVRAGRFPVIGDGNQRRSMVFIDNLVDGVLAAAAAPGVSGRGYWIADAEPYSVNDIVETVGRALVDEGLSVRPPHTRLPAIAGKVAETADRLIQRAGRYQQQLHVLGEMDKTIACDIGAARAELGYEPRVALYDGMRRSIQWCRAEGLEL